MLRLFYIFGGVVTDLANSLTKSKKKKKLNIIHGKMTQ